MNGKIKFYIPLVMAVFAAFLTGIQDGLTDAQIDAQEWVQVVILGTMAFNVWATANLPGYERMKTYVAAALLTLQLLFTTIIGGVSTPELINLVLTFLGAIGVMIAPQRLTRPAVINGEAVVVPPDKTSR